MIIRGVGHRRGRRDLYLYGRMGTWRVRMGENGLLELERMGKGGLCRGIGSGIPTLSVSLSTPPSLSLSLRHLLFLPVLS